MHPSFSGLFVHPKSFRPLTFFGDVKNSRWTNGFLWAHEEPEMYPVIDGIPIFVSPSVQQQEWPEKEIERLYEEKRIERNWENTDKQLEEKSDLTDFAKRMAEGEGLILDVASGPPGGFLPMLFHINPNATALMNDLSFGVLREWEKLLRQKGIANVSFAAFDATKVPIASDSFDIVSDMGGFDNIMGSANAIREAYRILRVGGRIFSFNSTIAEDDLQRLPKEVSAKWHDMNPPWFDGFLETFKQVGFKSVRNAVFGERELSPDESILAREAEKYGVRLHTKQYCTDAIK